jgi:hypothetical protein
MVSVLLAVGLDSPLEGAEDPASREDKLFAPSEEERGGPATLEVTTDSILSLVFGETSGEVCLVWTSHESAFA